MATVELEFTALPLHVRTARLIASAIARRIGVDESLVDEVKLAVGEACSRAVDVHREHDFKAPVLVRFEDGEDVFRISVFDYGPPLEQVAEQSQGERPSVMDLLDLDEAGQPQSDAPASLPSGIGLALIEGLVDDVSIAPRGDGTGTCVSMSWPLLDGWSAEDAPA